MSILFIIMLVLLIIDTLFVISPNWLISTLTGDRKLWKQFIKNADNFKFDYKCGYCLHFIVNDYEAIIWKSGLCSIMHGNVCILSTFDEKMSKKMADKLLQIYDKNKI